MRKARSHSPDKILAMMYRCMLFSRRDNVVAARGWGRGQCTGVMSYGAYGCEKKLPWLHACGYIVGCIMPSKQRVMKRRHREGRSHTVTRRLVSANTDDTRIGRDMDEVNFVPRSLVRRGRMRNTKARLRRSELLRYGPRGFR